MGLRLSFRALVILVSAFASVVPELRAQRIVDLTAADGTRLRSGKIARF